jgi:hypothetical protein
MKRRMFSGLLLSWEDGQEEGDAHEDLVRRDLLEGEGTLHEVEDDRDAEEAREEDEYARREGEDREEKEELDGEGDVLARLGVPDLQVHEGHLGDDAGRARLDLGARRGDGDGAVLAADGASRAGGRLGHEGKYRHRGEEEDGCEALHGRHPRIS